MKIQKYKKCLTIGLAGLLCAVSALHQTAADPSITLSDQNIAVLGVKLGKATPVNHLPLWVVPAKVTVPTSREYIVSATQPGLITRLLVAANEQVKKGQLIAQIDSPAYLELQGQYLKAHSLLQLATSMLERDKKLLQEGVIATRREQETLNQYNSALFDVNQSKQLLGIAGMTESEITQLAKTHRLNGLLSVYAPITGIVTHKLVAAGTRIDNLTPLYHIANLDELWIDMDIPQEQIKAIKIGDRVEIENSVNLLASASSSRQEAVINQIGTTVNTENQTILVRARYKNSQDPQKAMAIRAGQKLTVNIIQSNADSAYSVPNTAIAQYEGKSVIFIRTDKGFAVHSVTLISVQSDKAIVSGSALNGNEIIAVSGAAALKSNWLGLGSGE